jgi:hypothetical protein
MSEENATEPEVTTTIDQGEQTESQATTTTTESSGEHSAATTRTRGPDGRFTKSTPDASATKAATTSDAIDDDLYARAEKFDLTRYEADEMGGRAALEAELTRREREAARHSPEPTREAPRQEPAPAADKAPANAQAESPLAKLGDLDPTLHGEDIAERDKLLRGALQQALDEIRQLHSLRDEVGEFKKRAQEDERARQEAAFRKNAAEFDDAIADLGDDYTGIFGRGKRDEVLNTPYARVRGDAFELAGFLKELRPKLSFKEAAIAAANALFPKAYSQKLERDIVKRAKDAASQRGFSGASSGPQGGQPQNGDVYFSPPVQRAVERIERRRQGLG